MARPAAIVVCPLEFERRALARAGLSGCELTCCGPGADAVREWAQGRTRPGPVILCGLAGSLRERFTTGSAYVVSTVIGEDGSRRVPNLGGDTPDPVTPKATATSAGKTLTSMSAKRTWAERTGADLVDLESAAFAEAAEDRGWMWSIVRGVSDGPAADLPDDVDQWVDARGRTRGARVVRSLLGRRVGRRQLQQLRRDSAAAMKAAAVIVRRMLEQANA